MSSSECFNLVYFTKFKIKTLFHAKEFLMHLMISLANLKVTKLPVISFL